jgi:hypothetical protein
MSETAVRRIQRQMQGETAIACRERHHDRERPAGIDRVAGDDDDGLLALLLVADEAPRWPLEPHFAALRHESVRRRTAARRGVRLPPRFTKCQFLHVRPSLVGIGHQLVHTCRRLVEDGATPLLFGELVEQVGQTEAALCSQAGKDLVRPFRDAHGNDAAAYDGFAVSNSVNSIVVLTEARSAAHRVY